MDELTRGQKAAQTTKERKDRYEQRQAALRNDKERELQVLREIRDDPTASNSDKLEAVRLLRQITAQQ